MAKTNGFLYAVTYDTIGYFSHSLLIKWHLHSIAMISYQPDSSSSKTFLLYSFSVGPPQFSCLHQHAPWEISPVPIPLCMCGSQVYSCSWLPSWPQHQYFQLFMDWTSNLSVFQTQHLQNKTCTFLICFSSCAPHFIWWGLSRGVFNLHHSHPPPPHLLSYQDLPMLLPHGLPVHLLLPIPTATATG